MITTILLTAAVTAAILGALLHHRRAYVYKLEQHNLNLAEESHLLKSELMVSQDLVGGLIGSCKAYRLRLENEKLNTEGAAHVATLAHQRVHELEQTINGLRKQLGASALALAMEKASRV